MAPAGILDHAPLATRVASVRDLFERIDVDSRDEKAVAVCGASANGALGGSADETVEVAVDAEQLLIGPAELDQLRIHPEGIAQQLPRQVGGPAEGVIAGEVVDPHRPGHVRDGGSAEDAQRLVLESGHASALEGHARLEQPSEVGQGVEDSVAERSG